MPSSLDPIISGAGANTAGAVWDQVTEDVHPNGMSDRQVELDYYWSFYRTCQYDILETHWEGHKALGPLDIQGLASIRTIPPGFYTAADTPLCLRRPSAPYHLPRAITQRLSSFVFGEDTHPAVRIRGDALTQDWVDGAVEVMRLYAMFRHARDMGGGMGAIGIGLGFVNGQPRLELFDPRWSTPKFDPTDDHKVDELVIQYQKPKGDKLFWWRRVIDDKADTLYEPVEVTDDPPVFDQIRSEKPHNLGECPVVWVKNTNVHDDIDGDPDCQGVFDTVKEIDALQSQGIVGNKANADPTLLLSTTDKLGQIEKGSDNAIKLTNGTGEYLELEGSGARAALETAGVLRKQVLEITRCVLDDAPDGQRAQMTATEIRAKYASMLAHASELREQYGTFGIKPIIAMLIRAARKLKTPVRDEQTDAMVSLQIILPPKIVEEKDDAGNVTVNTFERVLGEGGEIELVWPPYFPPNAQDALQAAQAVQAARTAKVLDREAAARFLAPYFGVEDVAGMLERLAKEEEEEQEQAEQRASLGMQGFGLN